MQALRVRLPQYARVKPRGATSQHGSCDSPLKVSIFGKVVPDQYGPPGGKMQQHRLERFISWAIRNVSVARSNMDSECAVIGV